MQDQLAIFQETPQDGLSWWIYRSLCSGSQPIDLETGFYQHNTDLFLIAVTH